MDANSLLSLDANSIPEIENIAGQMTLIIKSLGRSYHMKFQSKTCEDKSMLVHILQNNYTGSKPFLTKIQN